MRYECTAVVEVIGTYRNWCTKKEEAEAEECIRCNIKLFGLLTSESKFRLTPKSESAAIDYALEIAMEVTNASRRKILDSLLNDNSYEDDECAWSVHIEDTYIEMIEDENCVLEVLLDEPKPTGKRLPGPKQAKKKSATRKHSKRAVRRVCV